MNKFPLYFAHMDEVADQVAAQAGGERVIADFGDEQLVEMLLVLNDKWCRVPLMVFGAWDDWSVVSERDYVALKANL